MLSYRYIRARRAPHITRCDPQAGRISFATRPLCIRAGMAQSLRGSMHRKAGLRCSDQRLATIDSESRVHHDPRVAARAGRIERHAKGRTRTRSRASPALRQSGHAWDMEICIPRSRWRYVESARSRTGPRTDEARRESGREHEDRANFIAWRKRCGDRRKAHQAMECRRIRRQLGHARDGQTAGQSEPGPRQSTGS